MNYIKVGSKYINLDNVTSIEPVSKEYAGESGIVQINFAGQTDNERAVWIEADEAIVFLAWLNLRCVDVLATMTSNPEYAPTPDAFVLGGA